MNISLLNVQGLTQVKLAEIEGEMVGSTLFCITETHKRDGSILSSNSSKVIHRIREVEDKKGGGMMLMWNKKIGLEVSEKVCKFKDLMITIFTKLTIRGMVTQIKKGQDGERKNFYFCDFTRTKKKLCFYREKNFWDLWTTPP